MVIEWREREHEDVDRVVHDDLVSQLALQRCGLYKFWNLGSMMDQPRLIQMLTNYWDTYTEVFILDGIPLKIEVEDIYFITGLSRRGKVVILRAHGIGGGLTIEE